MINVIDDICKARAESVYLLSRIDTANTKLQLIRFEGEVLAFMWRLETNEGIANSDIDNLRVVFQMALENRLRELVLLNG